jgi:hypothetical protein
MSKLVLGDTDKRELIGFREKYQALLAEGASVSNLAEQQAFNIKMVKAMGAIGKLILRLFDEGDAGGGGE